MKKNLSDYFVALAVIACSLVLLAALTFALSGYQLKKPTRTLRIDYLDVTGINLASQLRYAGAPAGHVIAIHALSQQERRASVNKDNNAANAVRVTVEINEDVPPLPEDVQASINADTLLSEKFISLSAGSPDKAPLASNAILQGHPGGLDELMSGAPALVQKADELIGSLNGDVKDIVPRLDGVLDSAHKAVDAGQSFLNNANLLVSDKGSLHTAIDNVNDAITKLKDVEKNLNDVLGKAGTFVGDANQGLDGRLKELSVVLQNLKVATTYLKEFSKSIGEKPNRVIFSGKPTQLQPESNILKAQQPLPAKPPGSPQPAQ